MAKKSYQALLEETRKKLSTVRNRYEELQAEYEKSKRNAEQAETELGKALYQGESETAILDRITQERERAAGLARAGEIALAEIESLEAQEYALEQEVVFDQYDQDMQAAFIEMKQIVSLMVEAAERYEAVKGKMSRPYDYNRRMDQKAQAAETMKDVVSLSNYPQTRNWPGWGDWLEVVKKQGWYSLLKT